MVTYVYFRKKKDQYKVYFLAHAKKYCKLSAFQKICENTRPRKRDLLMIAADANIIDLRGAKKCAARFAFDPDFFP